MLVLTRRAGESILIGDSIEVQIVAVDWRDLEARCVISAIDSDGYELRLRCTARHDGVAIVQLSPHDCIDNR